MIAFYILLIAVLNLGVGFGTAVVLARMPRTKSAVVTPPAAASQSAEPAPGAIASPAAKATPAPQASPAPEPPAAPLSAAAEEAAPPTSDAIPEKPLPSEETAEAGGEVPELTQSLIGLKQEVHKYDDLLTDVDRRLREVSELMQQETLESCVEVLGSAHHDYRDACQQLRAAVPACDGDTAIEAGYRRLLEAVDQQTAQLDQADQAISAISGVEAEEARRQVREQVVGLRAGNHRIRDALTQGAVAEDCESMEGTGDSPGPRQRQLDDLTGLVNRVCVESDLNEWWQESSQERSPRCLAIADVDQFGPLNEQYGPQVGDRILRALGLLMDSEDASRVSAARWSGQQFALLMSGVERDAAVGIAERIRQRVQRTRFQYEGEAIPVTIRCAVTDVRDDDSMESLLQRVGNALDEAKRYGRNRTFVHEGKFPNPVVPHELQIEAKVVEV